MRHVAMLVAVVAMGGTFAPCGAAAGPARREEQGAWALYAGPAPWGAVQAVFLLGDDWTPQLFEKVPPDVQVGAQGRLMWQIDPARPVRQVVQFDPAEVPVGAAALFAGPGDEAAIWKGRPRKSAVLLLAALARGDARTLALLKRWAKQDELAPGELAFALRATGFPKPLAVLAKTEPQAAYEHVSRLFQERRFGEAQKFLRSKAKRIDEIAAVRHDAAETACAPVRTARDGRKPTGLSWARLLEAAAQFAQGKRAAAAKSLKALLKKTPRLAESACPGSPDRPLPEHELFQPDRPAALLGQVDGFRALLSR